MNLVMTGSGSSSRCRAAARRRPSPASNSTSSSTWAKRGIKAITAEQKKCLGAAWPLDASAPRTAVHQLRSLHHHRVFLARPFPARSTRHQPHGPHVVQAPQAVVERRQRQLRELHPHRVEQLRQRAIAGRAAGRCAGRGIRAHPSPTAPPADRLGDRGPSSRPGAAPPRPAPRGRRAAPSIADARTSNCADSAASSALRLGHPRRHAGPRRVAARPSVPAAPTSANRARERTPPPSGVARTHSVTSLPRVSVRTVSSRPSRMASSAASADVPARVGKRPASLPGAEQPVFARRGDGGLERFEQQLGAAVGAGANVRGRAFRRRTAWRPYLHPGVRDANRP